MLSLSFANLCIGIINNDLEQTKIAVEELNNLTEDTIDYSFIIGSRDLANLAKNFDNESFHYFLLNIDNQPINRELWIFLSTYLQNKYEMSQISKAQILNFIHTQMAANYTDALKDIKYFTLIRFAMMIEEYNIVQVIKTRLEAQ